MPSPRQRRSAVNEPFGEIWEKFDLDGNRIGRVEVADMRGSSVRMRILEDTRDPERVGLHFWIPVECLASLPYLPTGKAASHQERSSS